MNIVKFKDIILENNELFNKKFKGKYAYWIRMQCAVSLNDISTSDYVKYEKNDELYDMFAEDDVDYIYTDDYIDYIDIVETDKVNGVKDFIVRNSFAPGDNITLEELKKFRTWIAKTLLIIGSGTFEESEIHVLDYYKNGMYNDIVKYLEEFGKPQTTLTNPLQQSPCNCQSYNNSMTTPIISTCDPIYIYRNNIYKKMVDMFSNIDFWSRLGTEFIKEFKLYIDNIVKCNLVLYKSQYVSDFVDCGCNSMDTQSEMMKILQQLSQSLQYIIDDDITGHKNYILDAFTNWARYIYENMEW